MRLFDPDATLTVRGLTERIAGALEDRFPDEVWVRGEISGLTRSAAGHVYFDLVDPGELGGPAHAHLPVALFAANRRAVNHQLKRAGITGRVMQDGLEIRIRGGIELHAPRGRVQLRMTAIDPEHTLGRLAAERDRLLRALTAEGLLRANAARPLPLAPHRVGLVTSDGSAGCRDFLHELESSGIAWSVCLVDARVQGHEAPRAVAAGLRAAAGAGVEVVALVRGGGARTDLVAFDSELVARTIAGLGVPVLTGVGHEVDRSVADEVAHTAAKTPTAAAAELVARSAAFLERTERLGDELARRAHRSVDGQHHRLAAAATSTARRGRRAVSRQHRRLASVGQATTRRGRLAVQLEQARLERGRTAAAQLGRRAVTTGARRLDGLDRQARALDPARTLARGWSITRGADGRAVRSVADLDAGAALVTELADGRAHSTVTVVVAAEGAVDGAAPVDDAAAATGQDGADG